MSPIASKCMEFASKSEFDRYFYGLSCLLFFKSLKKSVLSHDLWLIRRMNLHKK